jgi:hypothetical protein
MSPAINSGEGRRNCNVTNTFGRYRIQDRNLLTVGRARYDQTTFDAKRAKHLDDADAVDYVTGPVIPTMIRGGPGSGFVYSGQSVAANPARP